MAETVKSLLEGTRCNECYVGTLVYEGNIDWSNNVLTCTACSIKVNGDLKE